MTQADRVLHYIGLWGGITRSQAINDCGVGNLTAVISDIRKSGIPIVTTMIDGRNRFGEKIRFAHYSIGGGADGGR